MIIDHDSPLPSVQALSRRVEELTAELDEARRAVRARDDFLAIAAHELRTPMNSLGLQLAALERLARRSAEPKLVDQLARARRILDRYVRRATLLLDVTRLNAGRMPIQPGPMDLSEVVADVVDSHADEAGFHGVTLRTEAQQPLVGYWDAQAIEEILSNLVSNALKYGGAGPVTVRDYADGAAWACLEVEDRGPGIDEVQQRRIFEKFERLVEGPEARSGFGLGLWIVGQLVDAHGGSIQIRSTPGSGSVFTVRLPRTANASDREAPGAHDDP